MQLIMMLIFLVWDTQVDKTYKILMFVEFTLHHERQITNINTGKITACSTRTNAVKSRKLHTPDKEFRGKGCCFSLVLGGEELIQKCEGTTLASNWGKTIPGWEYS